MTGMLLRDGPIESRYISAKFGNESVEAGGTRAVSDCLIRPLPASVNALLVNCA